MHSRWLVAHKALSIGSSRHFVPSRGAITPGRSANLTLQDYRRVARDPGTSGKGGKLARLHLWFAGCRLIRHFREIRNSPTFVAAVVTRKTDQILDKRFTSSAQPSTTTICLETAVSGASSLIIRNRWPSAVTS